MWAAETTDEFDAWFAELGDAEQVEVIAKMKLLEVFGPQLGRPHADTLKGSKHANMKELRASSGEAVLRIAFAFDPNRTAIMLVGGDKSGVSQKRFYKQLIVKADPLYAAHLAKLRARKKGKGT